MKLTFTTNDSISKILHTLEKLPSYKSISIHIPSDHEIFLHDRWGKQIQEIITGYQLQVIFSCSDLRTKRYFDRLGLQTKLQLPSSWASVGTRILEFFHNGLPFGSSLVPKKQGLSALVLLAEAGVVGVILYLFWGLLSPTALITIMPATSMESVVYNFLFMPDTVVDGYDNGKGQLVLRYSTGTVRTTETLGFPLQKIDYEITNAVIEATITNTLPTDYSLIQGTTFVTDDNLIFKTNEALSIPAAISPREPSTITVRLESLPYQENGLPIGARGNLQKGTRLYIKNLEESKEKKEIYAVPTQVVQRGETKEHGIVRDDDVSRVQESLRKTLQQRKKELLYQHVKDPDLILLPFDDMIALHVEDFSTKTPAGSTGSLVEGEVTYSIDYTTIHRKDLYNAMITYINQRPQKDLSLLSIQRQNIIFYNQKFVSTGVYVVSTKVDLLRGYNFSEDTTNLLEDMRSKIAGKTKDEAKRVMLNYQQIGDVHIRIRPPRYDTLPPVASRIDFTRDK